MFLTVNSSLQPILTGGHSRFLLPFSILSAFRRQGLGPGEKNICPEDYFQFTREKHFYHEDLTDQQKIGSGNTDNGPRDVKVNER